MIRNETILGSYDTFASELHPARNYGGLNSITVREGNVNHWWGYLYFPVDGRKYQGATIRKARLILHHAQNNPSATFTVRRVTSNWREHQLNWNNKPTTTATGKVGTSGGGSKGDRLEVDVTSIVQEWAQGSAVYGFRLSTSTDADFFFYSSEASDQHQPKLLVEWIPLTDQPKQLIPNHDQPASDANPILRWTSTTPTSVHVQIDTTSLFDTPLLDSDWVQSDQTQYDTSLAASPPNLTDNATYWWRAQIIDEDGQTSAWSNATQFEYRSLGILNVTAPSGVIETTNPTITHTFTGRQQDAVKYELYILGVPDAPERVLIWQLGWRQTTDTSFDIPTTAIPTNKPLIHYDVTAPSVSYEIHVFVRDTYERVVEDFATFTFSRTNTVAPVDTFVVASEDGHLLATWHRTTVPSYFAVRVDGVLVADSVDPASISTGLGNYAMRLYSITPHLTHTFEVEAVSLISGVFKHSLVNPVLSFAFEPIGIWLCDPDTGLEVHILGDEDADVSIGETGETFFPLGRQDPVRLVDQVRGLEGSVSGTLMSLGTRTAASERANIAALKADPLATRRLVLGFSNIPVLVSEITVPPLPSVEEGYDVSFDFWQTDEFD